MSCLRWAGKGMLLCMLLLAACQPSAIRPLQATTKPLPSPAVKPSSVPARSSTLNPTSTATPSLTPSPVAPAPRSSQSSAEPALVLPYTSIKDGAAGRVRGRLFFPSEFIPSLAVYAVTVDGRRFYRVDTQPVPPGEPSYEIPLAEPGTYYVYAYPVGDETLFGGAYTYLAACEAGHLSPPSEGCWEDPQHELAPVEVRAGQAVEEVNILDWYGALVPAPPGDTGEWPTYVNEQLAYRISYPPHWQVRWERQGETAFGPAAFVVEGVTDNVLGSVRVTNGDPEELADQLIASLPPGDVLVREWRSFAGHKGLYVVIQLPQGQPAWWFVPRYELVYIVHAVTDSGLGSFDQMGETFAFVE